MSGTNPPIDYQNQYGVSVFQTATGIEVGALDTKDIMLYGSKSFNIVNIPDAINKDLPFRHLLAIAPNDIPSNFAVNDIITIKDLDTNPNHIINIQSANAVGKHFGIKFEGTTPFIIEETTSTNGLTIQPETTFTSDINVGNINGSAYPPVVASDTLQDVLTAGDNAGGLNMTGLNDVSLLTINGSAYPPISLPENATLYPPLVQAFTSTAGAITSMFRIRATIKSASFYKVTATVCCFVTTGNVVSYSLSFSTVLNPVINLNTDNLLLDYNNATTLVPAGRNYTMSGTGIFTGAEILNGLPDGLTVFYLNILTNTVIQPVNNPNGIDGLMPTTFYFEEVKTTP